MGGLCPSPRVLFGLVLSPQRRGGFGDSGGDTRWGLTCGHKRDITNPGDSICPQMVLSLLVVAQDGVPPTEPPLLTASPVSRLSAPELVVYFGKGALAG